MSCPEKETTEALLDGELDALASVRAERHVETCTECAALTKEIGQQRLALKSARYHPAPAALKTIIQTQLAGEPPPTVRPLPARTDRRFWSGAFSGAGATALAAGLAFFLLMAPVNNAAIADLTAAHQRSLISSHLTDVASSEHHTVKPWFATHADVSPPAPDLAADGFALAGGRADFAAGLRSAVVVYHAGAHVINVFAWADDRRKWPDEAEQNGFHLRFWQKGNLVFCAVSDMRTDEFARFVKLYRAARE